MKTGQIGGVQVEEVLHASELQHLLREVGGPRLDQVQVKAPSEMEPWIVTVSGALPIYGEVHFYEAEDIDLRGLKDAESILLFADQLNAMFDKAAVQLGRP